MSKTDRFTIENGVLNKYHGPGGDVVIPAGVTKIAPGVFANCASLTGVTIPEGVEEIAWDVFNNCPNLKHVTIPASVWRIDSRAFKGCPGLADSQGLVIVKNILFDYTGSGGAVVIPDHVWEIGYSAFANCTGVTSVTIPESVWEIGSYAFMYCTGLKGITIPERVSKIGRFAFWHCAGLKSVTIPKRIKIISDSAFWDCTNLANVVIPDSVTQIDDWAFKGCAGLRDVTIPESVTEIGEEAFADCPGLSSVTILNSRLSGIRKAFSDRSPQRFVISSPFLLPTKWRFKAALGFAENEELDLFCREDYGQYLKSSVAKLAEYAGDSAELVLLMCREKLLSAETAPLYMEKVKRSGNAQAIAALLEYYANQISPAEKERAERRREAAEDTVIERKIRRQTKVGIDDLTFAAAGRLNTFEKHAQLKTFILAKGGKLVSAVSPNVDYLIIADASVATEKRRQAEEFGIDVITEEQFNRMSGR